MTSGAKRNKKVVEFLKQQQSNFDSKIEAKIEEFDKLKNKNIMLEKEILE